MNWKVDGMTCTNCALTISKYLEKEGIKNVKANPASGEVLFDFNEHTDTTKLEKGLESLGYQVAERNGVTAKPDVNNTSSTPACMASSSSLMRYRSR